MQRTVQHPPEGRSHASSHEIRADGLRANRARADRFRFGGALAALLLSLLWLAPSGVVATPQPQGTDGADLAKLEQALSASPDDLRAGNDYRMAILKAGQYDRALEFFRQLVASNPTAANAHLNYGFEYVDKIPAAGAITQVILANNALTQFSKSLALRSSWIGYYTRGNSYLFWPKIFGKTRLALADLEEAMKIQKAEPKRSYHVRAYIALGDAYFKMDDPAKAAAVWKEGLALFPDNEPLKQRVAAPPDGVQVLLDGAYDPNKRVDTNLHELWGGK
jgi:tetratricopeptide (TPR) repeat protein